MTLYHIASEADWARARMEGEYTADSLKTQGFIHCSTRAQVIDVANALFRGRTDLVLLLMDESRLHAPVRYENLEGGTRLFPHLYGAFNLDAVVQVLPFRPDAEGRFRLPEETSGQ
ncbi:MAG TPA: DUF952 domain-containing protein [Anaerolinea thermolimosa]|uniref:DUF952 domain-containing protein n=1 Tax=Anaerolinea thermolimosa TaxID=229919 RepID=A0A3D1JE13_9CHLR|nr:DUF952 domain-containing protein [Anaerolinea thermolimosa]